MSDEKTEPATDHKRSEARKSGQVLKSPDVIVTFLLFGLASSTNFLVQLAFRNLHGFMLEVFEALSSYQHFDLKGILGILLKACLVILACSVPFAALGFLLTWLGNLLQVGVLITVKPLNPSENLKKLNPVAGFKNLFSIKKVIDLLKAIIKIIVIGWLAYNVIRDGLGTILVSTDRSIYASMALLGNLMFTVLQKITTAMVILMVVDYGIQKWQYEKSLKMSKQEIKDEYKKLEGDPHVKGRIRQKQMEMAMNAGRGSVENADVVITNPTHYAVALEYKPKKGQKAPVVVAKGVGAFALEIRRIAEQNFILIVEDPPTARALYDQTEVDQPIPPELFQIVAKIISVLYRGRRQPAASRPVPLVPVAMPPIDLDTPPPTPPDGTDGQNTTLVPPPEELAPDREVP
ncbi:MAG: flagellar biosynthesis protein FlhB [bacterium]|nr:flagellar biosynthesis protein FlhB [bacterium]